MIHLGGIDTVKARSNTSQHVVHVLTMCWVSLEAVRSGKDNIKQLLTTWNKALYSNLSNMLESTMMEAIDQ